VTAFSPLNAVTKIRSRVNTGDEWPGGSAVFQTTFFAGPNSTGNPVVAETPLPLGPRNCDQSSLPATANDREGTKSTAKTVAALNIITAIFQRDLEIRVERQQAAPRRFVFSMKVNPWK
jgi:hypothetical protein